MILIENKKIPVATNNEEVISATNTDLGRKTLSTRRISFSIPYFIRKLYKMKEGIVMQRRAKGMGTITNLGKGRRKPFLACLRKKSYGTYKSVEECEKALLQVVLEQEKIFPEFVGDEIKHDYTNYIYKMQLSQILPDSVYEFPDMTMINEMYKTQLVASGYQIHNKSAIVIPTFAEVWDQVFKEASILKSEQWARSMTAAFKKFKQVHDLPISSVTINSLQSCYNNAMDTSKGIGASTLNNMTIVLKNIYRKSEKSKFTSKVDNPLEYIDYHPTGEQRKNRKPFTSDEIKILMNDQSDISKIVILYIYTGLRPIELISMERNDIHLQEKYMIGGRKTSSGTNRLIPLHDNILNIIEYFLSYEFTYLFCNTCTHSDYQKYNYAYKDLMARLKLNHVEPYDTRYTFSTFAKTYNMDNSIRKKIMGHICEDLTDDVYTHEPLNYYLKEINKIKIC